MRIDSTLVDLFAERGVRSQLLAGYHEIVACGKRVSISPVTSFFAEDSRETTRNV